MTEDTTVSSTQTNSILEQLVRTEKSFSLSERVQQFQGGLLASSFFGAVTACLHYSTQKHSIGYIQGMTATMTALTAAYCAYQGLAILYKKRQNKNS